MPWADINLSSAIQFLGTNIYTDSPYMIRQQEVFEFAKKNNLENIENYGDLSPVWKNRFKQEHPELMKIMDKEQKRRAFLGHDDAIRSVLYDDIKSQFMIAQEKSDKELLSLETTPLIWQNEQKERAIMLHGMREIIFKDIDTKEPKTTMDFYYLQLETIKGGLGEVMSEEGWIELNLWVSRLPSADQKEIVENLHAGEYTDLQKEYYADLKILDSFFEIKDDFLGQNPEVAKQYMEYKKTPRHLRSHWIQRHPELRIMKLQWEMAQDIMRRENPLIDAKYSKWFERKPLHPENIDKMWQDIWKIEYN